jgi:nicotinate-nucleotide adenylyltransferase
VRVGILGGTFDPIHLGHLRAAENAREDLALDKVLFVPARMPPHRKGPLASPLDRFAMTALAVQGHPRFVVSDLELRREGPSYTVDTVEEWLRLSDRDSVFLVVGSDTFPEMTSWKDCDRLFSICTVAVAARPGEEGDAVATLGHLSGRRVGGPGLPVSSTEVRRLAAARSSIRYLVPDAVADYVVKRELYL